MIILFTAVILFFGIKAAPKGAFFEDSFSVAQTRALKGLFAILVMFHHLYAYLVVDYPSLAPFKNIGYLMVGGFFLISGYGLMWGVIHKENYLKGFFRKRILAILIPYYVIDLGYIWINYYTRTPEGFKTFVTESIFGLQMWFVPVMVLLYVLFRLSFIGYSKYSKRYPLTAPVILSVLVLIYVISFFATQKSGINVLYGRYWNNSALCFVLGIWYCIVKDKIKPIIQKYYVVLTGSVIVIFGLLFYLVCKRLALYTWSTLFLEIASALIFCCTVLLLSMKLKLGNGLLNLCGDLSFEIYMSHAIFITLFRWGKTITVPLGSHSFEYVMHISNNDLYLTAILISSFILSFIVHKLCRLILKPIQKSVRRVK